MNKPKRKPDMSWLNGAGYGHVAAPRQQGKKHRAELEQTLFGVQSGLDWLVEHAKLGDLNWSDLQEIKDNIKILEAECNGNR